MKNIDKAIELSNKFKCITIGERCKNIEDACLEMAKWKDEQINLLLDAIDYAYLKTDGTYGDLALAVVDKVEHLKSLRHGKIE